MQVDAYKAYVKYLGIKLHFTSEAYDYTKYQGRVKTNKSSFDKRNDKYQFNKLAKLYDDKDLEKLLISNFLVKNITWAGELLTPEATEAASKMKSIHESLSYIFSKDIDFLFNKMEQKETVFTGKNPSLIKHVRQNNITLETFIILTEIFNLNKKFDNILKDDIIWQELKTKARKYASFLIFDKDKMKNIFKVKSQNILNHINTI